MAVLTVHHWQRLGDGLRELRRVARDTVLVLTLDLDAIPAWQMEFLGEGLVIERPRFASVDEIAAILGGEVDVELIPTPADCADGMIEAFWNRPEALLDPAVRTSQSMWALLEPGVEDRMVERLRRALESGAWDAEYGHLRRLREYHGSLRLIISRVHR